MSKRLQVLMDEREYETIQRIAQEQRMTVAEWVRQALRLASRGQSHLDTESKLAVVRAATRHDFPAPDMDEMLQEIERGYQLDGPE